MNALVTQIDVRIPAEKVSVLLQCLPVGQKAPLFIIEEQTATLCQLLERYGWSTSRGGDRSVQLNAYRGRALDLAQDPVLSRLAGVVPAGNFLTGFFQSKGSEEIPWYILYTADERQIYYEPPSKQVIPSLLQCPACGSIAVQDWRYVEYTAIVYPVLSVNTQHIRTAADLKEIQFESVIRRYLECTCSEEVPKDSRTIVVIP